MAAWQPADGCIKPIAASLFGGQVNGMASLAAAVKRGNHSDQQ